MTEQASARVRVLMQVTDPVDVFKTTEVIGRGAIVVAFADTNVDSDRVTLWFARDAELTMLGISFMRCVIGILGFARFNEMVDLAMRDDPDVEALKDIP